MDYTCDEVASLLTPWVDEVLDDARTTGVDAHLAACAACRTIASRERLVRGLLRARAADLGDSAPAPLRARIEATSRARPVTIEVRSPRAWARRWMLPLAASLLVGVIGLGMFALAMPSEAVLAAELVLDHTKCQLLARQEPTATPEALATRWYSQHGWAISVPPSDPGSGLQLQCLRQCVFHGGKLAHLMYEYRGHTVSLFVLPQERHETPALDIMGVRAATWAVQGKTFGLVADVSEADFTGLMDRFQRLASR